MPIEKIVEPLVQQAYSPKFERQGSTPGPRVHHYPQVRCGVCEFHGVINVNLPSIEQYKLCPNDGKHPAYQFIRCSYCDATKDPEEVIRMSTINIYSHPEKPNTLLAVCDNFTCLEEHHKRFKA